MAGLCLGRGENFHPPPLIGAEGDPPEIKIPNAVNLHFQLFSIIYIVIVKPLMGQ